MAVSNFSLRAERQFNWSSLGLLLLLSSLVGYVLLSPVQSFGVKTFAIAGLLFFILALYLVIQNFEETWLFITVLFISFLLEKHFGPQMFREKYMIYNPTITATDVLILVLMVTWLIKTVLNKNALPLRFKFFFRAAIFIAIVAISTRDTAVPFQARVGLFAFSKGFLLFLFFQSYLKTRRQLILVLIALTIGGCVQGLVGIAQQVAHSHFGFASSDSMTRYSEFRVVGMLASPARFAQYLNFIIFIPLGLVLVARKREVRIFAGFAFFIMLGGILFAFARTTWLASFAGGIVVIWLLRERIMKGNIKVVLFFFWLTLLGSLIFGFIFFGPISERISELAERGDNMETSRINRGIISMNMIKDNPYFGVGINNATDNYLKYDYDELLYPPYANLSYVHNNYLLVASEIGVVGLVFYLILILSLMKSALELSRAPDNMVALTGTVIFASFCSFLLAGMTVAYPGNPFLAIFWFYLAVAGALLKNHHLLFEQPDELVN
jgi:O-antigen ligase